MFTGSRIILHGGIVMRKSYKLCMMLLLFGFLCMLPNAIHAADKKKEQEFDFNSNKTLTVTEDKS